jgi:Asp/Glu/hydantoin racemase
MKTIYCDFINLQRPKKIERFVKPVTLLLIMVMTLVLLPNIITAEETKMKQPPYPMHTPQLAYPEGDITWKKGRNVAGAAIGVLQFPANIPMMPGNIGNASTFNFPVIYHQVNGIDIWALVEGRSSEEDLAKIMTGAKALEAQGVRAIVANCGYWANYQKEIAAVVDVPFVSSSLVQIPWLLNILKPSKKVLVLTLNVELMEKVPALKSVGVQDRSRLVIVSGDSSDEYKRVAAEEGAFNPQKFEREVVQIVKKALKDHPEVGAILLECTELTSFAWAVQEATGLPVFDSITPIKWMYSGVVQRPYYGHL